MKLHLFRLSLKERVQKSVFERRKADDSEYTREEWLTEVLSEPFTFIHRNNEFHFVPVGEKLDADRRILAGWVARDREVFERTAPWDGLDPTQHRSWQAALFLIDPSAHEDGQKVAFEHHGDVGNPDAVLSSLAKSLTDRGDEEPFSVIVYRIIQERSFAAFAAENEGKITRITYDAAVPNMFSGPDDFTKEMRDLKNKANVSRVKTQLDSDGALETEASKLKEIAGYVERGGGSISANTSDGKHYRSDEHAVTEDVDTSGTEPETDSYWSRIKGALGRIF